jgi:hypothetical protein
MSLPVSALLGGDRRMEAEAYLLSGFGLRIALEARLGARMHLGRLAHIWQPSRLKGIQVSSEFGTPFLAATQVFDLRPIPRKWLSLERTESATQRFVTERMILVTCSGLVGRTTLAYAPHLDTLISHDLLRVEANDEKHWGWLYAYLRSPTARAMMTSVKYGHVIKHLEVGHLSALPIPDLPGPLLDGFTKRVKVVLSLRDKAHAAIVEAEARFEAHFGPLPASDSGEDGFVVRASDALFGGRRRMDGLPHNPRVRAIRQHLAKRAKGFSVLGDSGFAIWLPTRFRRIPAEAGVDLVSSSALFEVNPDIEKRIADADFGDPFQGRVEPGWLLLARSGQIYGLNGSLALATKALAGKVISDDAIRIAPDNTSEMRVGYAFTALSHPTLGRHLVKSLAYGSSIPHIDPVDVKGVEVVRLSPADEDAIADLAERAADWRAEADLLENELADEAEQILSRFIAGEAIR